VKSFGDNEEATRIGVAKLLELLGTHSTGVIVVPDLGQVKSTMLVNILGEDLSKSLIRDRQITFKDGKALQLCSQATLKSYRRADVYLALWGTEYAIEDIEALPGWQAAILVTWIPADSARWVQKHSVQVIYDDGKG
jgi:hypothetical protein